MSSSVFALASAIASAPEAAAAEPLRSSVSFATNRAPTAWLLEQWKSMTLIRRAEEAIAEMVESGEARCPCHLYIGQEAIAAGVCAALDAAGHGLGRASLARALSGARADRSKRCSPKCSAEPRDAREGAADPCT